MGTESLPLGILKFVINNQDGDIVYYLRVKCYLRMIFPLF